MSRDIIISILRSFKVIEGYRRIRNKSIVALKLAVLVYKSLHGLTAPYLTDD